MAPVDKTTADGTDSADKSGTALPDTATDDKTSDDTPSEKSGKQGASVKQDVDTKSTTTPKLEDTQIFSEYIIILIILREIMNTKASIFLTAVCTSTTVIT